METLIPAEVAQIEADAAKASIPISAVLARANVAVTTWWRWRARGTDPRLATLHRVQKALAELQARGKRHHA